MKSLKNSVNTIIDQWHLGLVQLDVLMEEFNKAAHEADEMLSKSNV